MVFLFLSGCAGRLGLSKGRAAKLELGSELLLVLMFCSVWLVVLLAALLASAVCCSVVLCRWSAGTQVR